LRALRDFVVARRLAVPELVDWLSKEMNGYNDQNSVPDYQPMWGQFEALDLEGHGIIGEGMSFTTQEKQAKGNTADGLRAELAALKALAESPKPTWGIIKATIRSFKAVAEEAAGNILAGLAQSHMATLLALATV
jgi:hypothetical protein